MNDAGPLAEGLSAVQIAPPPRYIRCLCWLTSVGYRGQGSKGSAGSSLWPVPFQRVHCTVRRQVRDQKFPGRQRRRRNIKGVENVR
jgi:hypothetical protein